MKHEASGAILVLFARPPRSGAVKPRLAAGLGDARALALYTAFLRDSIALVRRVSPWGIRGAIAWSEPPTADELRSLAEPLAEPLDGVETLAQGEGDLGQRLSSTLAYLLSRGHDRVLIMGADTPSLPPETIKSASELLRDRDLVFGPATDGGYYLIGARAVFPEIFRDIPWGTDKVLSETLRILKIFGIPRVLLQPWSDVDTPEDLDKLAAELRDLPANDPAARFTRAVLSTS